MFHKNPSFISTLTHWLVIIALVASTVLVLPISENFIFTSKLYLFFDITILLGFAFIIHSLQRKSIEFVLSPFTIPVTFFGIAIACSTFFTNSYPVEGLLNMGGLFLSGVLFILFAGTLVTKELSEKIIPTISITAAILTLLSATQALGYGPAQIINQITPMQVKTDLGFNVAGNTIFALQFIIITIVGIVAQTVATKHISKVSAIVFPILVCGILLFGYGVLPGKPGSIILPSWAASWSVTLDTIRSPRAALIGGGISSYSNLYNKYKPIWVNGTPAWSITFTQSNNLPLTLLSTAGFLGLLTWLVLIYKIVITTKNSTGTARTIGIMLLTSILFQLFLPTNIVIFIFQVVCIVGLISAQYGRLPLLRFQALSMTMDSQSSIFHIPTQKVSFPIYIISGILGVFLLFFSYALVHAYVASFYFIQAAFSAQKNDVVGMFTKQQLAIQNNPFLDSYRRQYAITSMTIATSLANKANITDEEKTQVAELLQLSVREGRSAVMLDPNDADNLAVLAEIYRNMIGVAEQADQFSVQSYVQAIQNSPANPVLRLALGNVLVQQKQATEAASLFRQTIDIKPDYPDSYYQLAVTLTGLGAYKDAQATYQALLKLLNPETPDYAQVTKELAAVDAKIKQLESQRVKVAPPTPTPTAAPSLINQALNEDSTAISNPTATAAPQTDLGAQIEASPKP
ncbi:tetratricopeptide repeat protein [Candidatus Woesebacteria bacterium]|nr:tetratricopeptide repeat protein [Candidatus Woesebacteria bacterium]